jgi:hypothetical protein
MPNPILMLFLHEKYFITLKLYFFNLLPGKSVAIFLKRLDGRNKRLARIEVEQLMLKYEES